MYKLFLLSLVANAATLATTTSPILFDRSLNTIPCSDHGMKDCGSGCIETSWTCCPDYTGGCSPSEYCSLGDNGEYGCCPRGETCDGFGFTIPLPTTSLPSLPAAVTGAAGRKYDTAGAKRVLGVFIAIAML